MIYSSKSPFLTAQKIFIWIKPVQDLNLNRRSISGLEPERHVTRYTSILFLTWELHEGGWSTLRPERFTHWKNPDTHFTASGAGRGWFKKCCFQRDWIPEPSSFLLVAIRTTYPGRSAFGLQDSNLQEISALQL